MTLQLLHSEFPYIWGKFYLIFYQCTGYCIFEIFLVHYVLPVLDRYLLLYFLEFGIWNLDHLVTCGIPYANTYRIPRNSAELRQILLLKIPRNSAEFAEFRMFFKKRFSKTHFRGHPTFDLFASVDAHLTSYNSCSVPVKFTISWMTVICQNSI
jgi:hypothetical protein